MSTSADQEYASADGYFQIHFLMVRAHETLLNGLDSVMRQAAEDHSADMHNWLGYVSAWAACVESHHSAEEKQLFPFFESKDLDVHSEKEQHAKLHDDLDALSSSIREWQTSPSTYDKTELQSMLERLAPNFRQHLDEEVKGLAENRLAPKVTSQELKDCIGRLEKEVMKNGDPFIHPVFMMSHTPPEHKYWSNMGWFMYRIVIPALSYRHAGYWKYSPEPLNLS